MHNPQPNVPEKAQRDEASELFRACLEGYASEEWFVPKYEQLRHNYDEVGRDVKEITPCEVIPAFADRP